MRCYCTSEPEGVVDLGFLKRKAVVDLRLFLGKRGGGGIKKKNPLALFYLLITLEPEAVVEGAGGGISKNPS